MTALLRAEALTKTYPVTSGTILRRTVARGVRS